MSTIFHAVLLVVLSFSSAHQIYGNLASPLLLKRWVALLLLFQIQPILNYFLDFIPFFTLLLHISKLLIVHPSQEAFPQQFIAIFKFLDTSLLASYSRKTGRLLAQKAMTCLVMVGVWLISHIQHTDQLEEQVKDLLKAVCKRKRAKKQSESRESREGSSVKDKQPAKTNTELTKSSSEKTFEMHRTSSLGAKPRQVEDREVHVSKVKSPPRQVDWDIITTKSSQTDEQKSGVISFKGEVVVIRGTRTLPPKTEWFDVQFDLIKKEVKFIAPISKKVYQKHSVIDVDIQNDSLQFKLNEAFFKTRSVKLESKQSCARVYENMKRWLDL